MVDKIKLGVLDFCALKDHQTPREVLIDTLKLASMVEEWGYSRYWLGEHHLPGVAHVSPELMMMALAGRTRKIHVGTGSLLLYYHNNLKVANDFRLLTLLFPGRIDLGLGRSNADLPFSQLLLEDKKRALDVAYYEEKVAKVIAYLQAESEIHTIPAVLAIPEIWVQGTKQQSMLLAAQYGTGFTLSMFHKNSQDYRPVFEEYRATFQPSLSLKTPKCNIAIAGVCAPTETEARQLRDQYKNDFIVPTVIGTPDQCRENLLQLQHLFDVDEFIFLDVCEKLSDRARSYQLLAEACNLR